MPPKAARLWALLCLALVVQLAVSQSFAVVRRDDKSAPATTLISSSPAPAETNTAGKDGDKTDPKSTGSKPSATDSTGTITGAPSSTHGTTGSPLPTIVTDGPLDNSTFFNSKISAYMAPPYGTRQQLTLFDSNNSRRPVAITASTHSRMGSRRSHNARDWSYLHPGWHKEQMDSHLLFNRLHDSPRCVGFDRIRYECPH